MAAHLVDCSSEHSDRHLINSLYRHKVGLGLSLHVLRSKLLEALLFIVVCPVEVVPYRVCLSGRELEGLTSYEAKLVADLLQIVFPVWSHE